MISLTAYAGRVYAGVDEGTNSGAGTYAMDAASGRKAWSQLNNDFAPVCYAASNGRVFGTGAYSIAAVSAATGRVLWNTSAGAVNIALGSTWIACSGDTVLTPTELSSGSSTADIREVVLALDARTGHRRWVATFPSFVTALTVAGAVVYAGSGGGRTRPASGEIAAFAAADGKRRWVTEVSAPPGALAWTEGILVGAWDNMTREEPVTYALDAATGRRLWQRHMRFGTPLAAGNGLVFALSDDFVALSARTGEQVWKRPAQVVSLVVTGGVVYAAAEDGTVQAIEAATGRELWSHPVADPIAITAAGGAVYASSAGGYGSVYAFQT